MSGGPDVTMILESWWGECWQGTGTIAAISAASNLGPFGGNPKYQLSDFLSVYPKFGTGQQGVVVALLANPGEEYSANDQLVLVQPDASGCVIKVVSV